MLSSSVRRLFLPLIASTLALILLFSMMATLSAKEQLGSSQIEAAILYVTTGGADSGNDCLSTESPCQTIQHAVDQAEAGDEVRVAEGTYNGSTLRSDSQGYTYTQVVYIDKGLTLRGGYSTADWNSSDPQLNEAIIDALENGRGVTINETEAALVTFDGFTITGGDYTGLGNPPGLGNRACNSTGYDCGGGLAVRDSAVALKNLVVRGNTAGSGISDGGGLYFYLARESTIDSVIVESNQAFYRGGGMHVDKQYEPLTISNSSFISNTAQIGGGIHLNVGIAALIEIRDSLVTANVATDGNGGGVFARPGAPGRILHLKNVELSDNLASRQGKALYFDAVGSGTPEVELWNLILTGNGATVGGQASDIDAVVAAFPGGSLTVKLAHVTADDNLVPSFLWARPGGSGKVTTVVVTNTLLANFTNAYAATGSATSIVTVKHTNTYIHGVDNLHLTVGNSPVFTSVNPLELGDPLLDENYRLHSGSPAIDAGIEAGVSTDIDGEFRPQGFAPDIGADEVPQIVEMTSLGLSGPSTLVANVPGQFLAEVEPESATRPITYTWEATGQAPITRLSGHLSDSISFLWSETGSKTITVTVENSLGSLQESAILDVISEPVLGISKEGPALALTGSTVTYTLTVRNDGAAAANSLIITDVVPLNGLSPNPLDGGILIEGDTVVQWTLAELAGESLATFRFQVTVVSGLINDDYGVTAGGGFNASGAIVVTTIVGTPELSITKTGPRGAAPGETIGYELTVTNNGPITATAVLITDTLPVGATYIGGGDLDNGLVSWQIDNLPLGGTVKVPFSVSAALTVVNEAYGVSAAGGFQAQGGGTVTTFVSAGDRYVATNGADSLNDFTVSASPCATIQQALDLVNTGEVTGSRPAPTVADWSGKMARGTNTLRSPLLIPA